MIVHLTRFIMMVAGAISGFSISQLVDWSGEYGLPEYTVILVFIILGWSIGFLLGGIVGRELASAWMKAEERLAEVGFRGIALGSLGLIVGLAAAVLVSTPLRVVEPVWLALVTMFVIVLVGGWLGMRVALLTRSEIDRLLPVAEGSAPNDGARRVLLLDTSAVIDGRFLEMQRLGYLDGDIRVPRFVLAELQTLADSADDVKRGRGRRGLDLLSRLEPGQGDIVTFEIDYPELASVDDKLMKLAAETGGVAVTLDHNLTSVARLRGIAVLNINELASALKPNFLPGERIRIRVVREGKEPGQGVGYLEDGTMVVVAEAGSRVGSDVDCEVTSVLQTSAGRMVFARMKPETPEAG